MTASELTLKQLPAALPMLMQAALTRKKPGPDPEFPQATLLLEDLLCSQQQLQRYREVCRFSGASQRLPLTFLHILAFRLQLKLMLAREFPVAPMGCVHLGNSITQYRAIGSDEHLRLSCRVADHQRTEKGIEFSFVCDAFAGGDLLWRDSSRYLSRQKKPANGAGQKSKARSASPDSEPVAYDLQQPLAISRRDARQYARVSGDFNPIHLADASAKLLGFKSMIIHGMWSKAACLAALETHIEGASYCCEVEFKTPVFLPAVPQLHYSRVDQGLDFELRSAEDHRPHLIGRVRYLETNSD